VVAWWHRGRDTQLDVARGGWFGADTYSGGIDKLGHGFSSYVDTRMPNRGSGRAGMPADPGSSQAAARPASAASPPSIRRTLARTRRPQAPV